MTVPYLIHFDDKTLKESDPIFKKLHDVVSQYQVEHCKTIAKGKLSLRHGGYSTISEVEFAWKAKHEEDQRDCLNSVITCLKDEGIIPQDVSTSRHDTGLVIRWNLPT